MGVLEQVTQFKKEGRSDEQIIAELKKQGVSPRDISDALNHAHIKSAVSDIQGGNDTYSSDEAMAPAPSPQGGQANQYSQEVGGEGYQNYDQGQQQDYGNYDQNQYQDYSQNGQQDYGNYAPQDYSQQQTQYAQPAAGQEYYPQQDYQQGAYNTGYDQYGGGQQANSDSVVEIAEQVFEEKISDVQKKLNSMEEFKTITETKLDSINEKVKRMEAIMDKLQIAILERIGSYGKNLDSIKKEMSMMQDTFTKSMDSVVGKSSSKSPTGTTEKTTRTRKTVSKK